MAKIIPGIDKIEISKQKPTEGELFLLNYLNKNFDSDSEVYFQPCFNGDRPDIVIIKKNVGAIIIEVKDWNLQKYYVDSDNNWHIKSGNHLIRSPFQQVFTYKKNIFEVHANTLLERKLASESFYSLLKPLVYFHSACKKNIETFYREALENLRTRTAEINNAFKNKQVNQKTYDQQISYLYNKKRQIERDSRFIAITNDTLDKIAFKTNNTQILLNDNVYKELTRLLQPPYHYANEGKEIEYSDRQKQLSESSEHNRAKIRGIAGSGKTTVLAKLAVNAHKRHEKAVLILTFNLTLRMYIKDKINEVREDFPWSAFHITNYHKFIGFNLNKLGISTSIQHDMKDPWPYLEEHFFSNENIFDGYKTNKYKTILIDEAQDYRPEWQKILRKYFLEDGGEMVLFSDEKQNLYKRGIDEEKRANIIKGFGRWKHLSKSFRYKPKSPIISIAVAFQQEFLANKYNIDNDDSLQFTPGFNLVDFGVTLYSNWSLSDIDKISNAIVSFAKKHHVHPNDITILSAAEEVLREIDLRIRSGVTHKEKTIISFPMAEEVEKIKKLKLDSKIEKMRLNEISTSRKNGFNLNSGVMKITTTHSFKGFESPTIFLIINESDTPELVYTGLTRAKENIVVFLPENSKYNAFFTKLFNKLDTL